THRRADRGARCPTTIPILRRCFERSRTPQPIRVCRSAAARQPVKWVALFVSWYNTEHRHSAIRYVAPDRRHTGTDVSILARPHALQPPPTTDARGAGLGKFESGHGCRTQSGAHGATLD